MGQSDFALGRLGGLRSRLLSSGGLVDLLARPDLLSRVERLRGSLWGGTLPAPAAGRAPDLDAVEESLAEAFREEVGSVLRDLSGLRKRLFRSFLLFDDAASLKGPVRALARGLKPEAAASLVAPSAGLRRGLLLDLVAATDADAAAARLAEEKSPFAPAVAAHAAELRKPGGLLRLEVALDRVALEAVFRHARGPGADRAVLRDLSAARVDLVNARVLLAAGGTPEAEELYMPGGRRLGEGPYREMAALGAAPLARRLADELEDLVGPREKAALAFSDPLGADHLMGHALARRALALARRLPLTLAVPCAFALALGEELRRVRLALRGAELGFPPNSLLDLLEA